jgi:hypothetical protein
MAPFLMPHSKDHQHLGTCVHTQPPSLLLGATAMWLGASVWFPDPPPGSTTHVFHDPPIRAYHFPALPLE